MLDLRAERAAKPLFAWMLAGVAVWVAVFSRLVYVALPFDGDGAMFAYMGKLVADGGRFGEDLVDNKFPTVGLITSAFWRVFAAHWSGYVIAQLLLALAAALLLARQAARSFGEYARPAAFFTAIVLLNLNAAVMGGFQLETILAFFACLSACCGLEALRSGDRRDAIACGLAAGCAAMVKPTGIGILIAFLFAAVARNLVDRHDRAKTTRLISGAITGAALPALASILYLHETDTLRLMPAIAAQIGQYAASSSFAPEDLFRPISVVALFAAAMVIRGWVYRRPRHRVESGAGGAEWVLVIAWLAIEFAGVLMQRRMYAYHFLPLACPAALVFAALPRRVTIGQLAGVLALPVVLSAWGAVDVLRSAQRHPPTWPGVGAWLDRHTLPGDRVWRDITPAVLLTTDLRPASRVQLTFLFMNSDDAPDRFSGILLDDLARSRPRFVVLPGDVSGHVRAHTHGVVELSRQPVRRERFAAAWERIERFVNDRYRLVARVGGEAIYQLREVHR
mgnify:CR=1 FL=1